jgi:hypothetical protein
VEDADTAFTNQWTATTGGVNTSAPNNIGSTGAGDVGSHASGGVDSQFNVLASKSPSVQAKQGGGALDDDL